MPAARLYGTVWLAVFVAARARGGGGIKIDGPPSRRTLAVERSKAASAQDEIAELKKRFQEALARGVGHGPDDNAMDLGAAAAAPGSGKRKQADKLAAEIKWLKNRPQAELHAKYVGKQQLELDELR